MASTPAISPASQEQSTTPALEHSSSPAAKEDRPSDATRAQRSRRVTHVSPRDLAHFTDARELVLAMYGAIAAHKEIYERAAGELHGDINTNTILILDRPRPDRECPVPEGALVYWEPPISLQTLRKIGNLDPPQPLPNGFREAMRAYVFEEMGSL